MTWRIIYQGIVIGIITICAFLIGISSNEQVLNNTIAKYPELTQETARIEIAQTMAFVVIAFSELVHIFDIRNNKKSIFKTGIGGNKILFLALAVASALMFTVLLIPKLQEIFGIISLPVDHIVECILLILVPVVVTEIMKLLKINTSKDE